MRDQQKIQTTTIAILLAAVFSAAMGGQYAAAQTQTQQVAPPAQQRALIVSIPDRKIVLLENGVVTRVYPVAVGKPSTPSPAGSFSIVRRVSDPTYSHNGRLVAPGPKNPVGSRWMGLSAKGYGIHGTNEPNSIGKAASHGCIRMGKADIEDLFTRVQVGDAVEIHAQRDGAVTMALGGPIALPPVSTPAPAVLLAGNTAVPAPHTGQ
jgi:lipoprotein-anchoring transpeptidase ErfK/SrfK